MTETIEEGLPPVEETTTRPSSVGRALAAAREQAGMTIEQAASNLRLSVRQVQALEEDDATALPAPTFVRGFIRNYAKLLQLDAEMLLEIYRVYTPATGLGNISLHSENIPILNHDKKAWLPYVLASAVVALALAGWMFYMEYLAGAKPVDPPAESQEVSDTAQEPVPIPLPLPDMSAVPVEVSAVAPEVPAPTTAVVSSGTQSNSRLTINFGGQSWVSVTDRDGKEIFNKSQDAGTQAIVEGAPPLGVIIGNASAVKVSFNDKPIDLALHTKANVARLTLE